MIVIPAPGVHLHPEAVGSRAVVLGGGLVGVELAIHLAGLGRQVTVVELLPCLNNGGNVLHQNALDTEIRARGVVLSLNTRVERIGDGGVTGSREGEERFFPADTVIAALGQTPLREEAEALRFCAPEFYVPGDCSLPANILQATAMADAIVAKGNDELFTEVSDYSVPLRNRPVLRRRVSYAELRSGTVEIDGKKIPTAPMTSLKKSRDIAAELKRQVQQGEFLLTVPSAKLPLDTVKHVLHASDEAI